MLSDDSLHSGESYPGAFKLFVAVKPLKGSEQFVGIFLIKSGAIVANVDYDLIISGGLVNLNHSSFSTAGVFHGIG